MGLNPSRRTEDRPGPGQDRIGSLIEPALQARGYALVRVQMMGGKRQVLQVMAERQDGAAMTVDDCARISRDVSAILDVEDPIAGAYTLEVSSPGIDRPLVRAADYQRFAGFVAKLETDVLIDGRRRFQGRILGLAEGEVELATEAGPVRVPLARIAKAKLVLTDDLIAAAHPGAPPTATA